MKNPFAARLSISTRSIPVPKANCVCVTQPTKLAHNALATTTTTTTTAMTPKSNCGTFVLPVCLCCCFAVVAHLHATFSGLPPPASLSPCLCLCLCFVYLCLCSSCFSLGCLRYFQHAHVVAVVVAVLVDAAVVMLGSMSGG